MSTTGISLPETVLTDVSEYYGKVLSCADDLKISTCCTACGPPPEHVREALRRIPKAVVEKFYGCGNPLPTDSITGLKILDLGCGSGRDVFIAAILAGKTGTVVGVDMTQEMLDVAQAATKEFYEMNPDAARIEWVHGFIEDLPGCLPGHESSFDVIISNCVVNLSNQKDKVLSGSFEMLKPGGEMFFSDVYCDRRLSASLREHKLLYGECLSGALYLGDFHSLCRQVGFNDPRQVKCDPTAINDRELASLLGAAKFTSRLFRLFKLPPGHLEDRCEDYGQVAFYNGGIDNSIYYALDDHHIFEKDRPVLVCGNTAAMVQETRLAKYFKVIGDRRQHFGVFDCSSGGGGGGITAAASAPAPAAAGGGECCAGGGCS